MFDRVKAYQPTCLPSSNSIYLQKDQQDYNVHVCNTTKLPMDSAGYECTQVQYLVTKPKTSNKISKISSTVPNSTIVANEQLENVSEMVSKLKRFKSDNPNQSITVFNANAVENSVNLQSAFARQRMSKSVTSEIFSLVKTANQDSKDSSLSTTRVDQNTIKKPQDKNTINNDSVYTIQKPQGFETPVGMFPPIQRIVSKSLTTATSPISVSLNNKVNGDNLMLNAEEIIDFQEVVSEFFFNVFQSH